MERPPTARSLYTGEVIANEKRAAPKRHDAGPRGSVDDADPPRRGWLRRLFARRGRARASVREAESDRQFHDRVLPREIDYIEKRRRAVFGRETERAGVPRSPDQQKLGVALSGGGIRSATFNLGVLQALEKRGVFRFIDYLSTVSGGGFLGSSLSTLLSQRHRDGEADAPPADFPFRFSDREEEVPAVAYLRNNSNYLAPRGLIDYLRIFAVLVRGIILNFLVLVPFLLVSSMVVTVVYGQALLERLQRDSDMARVADLLERNWIGFDAEQPVDDLVEALEMRGMLDVQRGQTRRDVREWLRGDEKRGGTTYPEALPPLVKGAGDEDDEGRFAFRDGVEIDDVVRRLWQSGTLRNLDSLEEIDAVALAVRDSKYWLPSDRRSEVRQLLAEGEERRCKKGTLGLGSLYWSLESVRDSEGEPLLDRPLLEGGDARWRMLELLKKISDKGEVLIQQVELCGRFDSDDESVPIVVAAEGEGGTGEKVDPEYRTLEGWRAAGAKPNLRRILQELYTAGFFNPKWLENNRPQGGPGNRQPPLGYGEAYELATIERALRADAAQALAAESPTAPTASNRESPDESGLPFRPLTSRKPRPGDFADSAILHPSYRGEEEIEGLFPPKRGVNWNSLTWRDFARNLWQAGAIDEGELERQVQERIGEKAVLVYGGHRSPGTDPPDPDAGWNPYTQPFRGTLGLLILGLTWVLLYPVLLLIAVHAGLRRFAKSRGAAWWRDLYERSFAVFLVSIAAVAFIELQPYLIYNYRRLQGGEIWWPIGIGVASLVVSMIAGPAIAFFRGPGKSLMVVVVALMGPILPLLVYVHIVLWVIREQFFWNGYYLLNQPKIALFLAGAALVTHVINLPIDVNSTSLHGFYRDRLSAAYLMRVRRERRSRSRRGGGGRRGEVVLPEHDVQLSETCAPGSGAPYHLINATLNLQGAKDPSLRRRRGDFFQFSKYHVGSKETGYCGTDQILEVFPRLYVSSAMAVSAAAASPNMGTFTTGPLVVLMALLNIRLGFWLPNPRRVERLRETAGSSRWRRLFATLAGSFSARPGAFQLVKEMLSDLRGDVRLVNLSDGGHMENTGAFQLLRRRCQFIIVGDAEADPKMAFGALAALMRYARIDLGIEIDIHVDDLRLDSERESRQHCALGVIHYPETDSLPADVGYLLYIKSSVTGDESEIVSEHRQESPLFPHESTADQNFQEGQFEAYRDLGFHIADGLFDGLPKERIETFEECSSWFEMLSISLSPGLSGRVAFADIASALGDIRRMLREPGYKGYFYEIYPELDPGVSELEKLGPEEEAEVFRHVFHLANIQLQLMESLFVSSELSQRANRRHPANRGWMNLFRRWVRAPSFRRAYLASITTYSAPFQQFCQTALGLELELEWEERTEKRLAELGGGGDESGFDLPEQVTGEGERVLMLTASLEESDPILIAETVLRVEGEAARVRDLDLRAGYEGAGMRARSMLALKEWARRRNLTLSFSEAASVAAQEEPADG